MADQVTNYTAVSADALTYWITEKMIRLSERQLLLGGMTAEKFTLQERMGKTMRINRANRFPNPTVTLTEGTPPDAVKFDLTTVDVTVEQWGIVGLLTDIADVTTRHPMLNLMIDRASRAMNEAQEREIALVLMAGTNVFFAGAVANRAALDGTKYPTTQDLLKMTTLLRDNGAGDFEGGLYIGVCPPQFEADMMGDSTFATAASYSQVVRLNVAEIGVWGGVRWSRENFLPKFAGVGAPGTQSATVAGFTESGAGGTIGNSKFVVVARDTQSGYERKISQPKTAAAGSDSATLTMPTSTGYVYDVYMSNTSGAAYKLVASGLAAGAAPAAFTSTSYTNGTARTPTSAPASGMEVFVAFVFGREAYGDVQLSGMTMQSYITPAGASWSNPLAQGRKVGNKQMHKPSILDNNYFARLEFNSHYPANLAA